MGKTTFVLGSAWAQRMLEVPDDDFANIVKAVFKYAVTGEREPMFGLYKVLVDEMTDFIAENNEKYAAVCEKRREAGSIGGKQKQANAKQTVANATKCYQMVSKTKQIGYDNDNDNDNGNDNDNVLTGETLEKGCFATGKENERKRSEEVRKVVDAWNTLPNVPAVKKIDTGRDCFKMLNARLDKYGIDLVLEAIENVRRSEFLQGQGGRGWRADFSWFVKPNNFPKVLEGKYNDTESAVKQPEKAQKLNAFYNAVQTWANDYSETGE